MGNGRFAPVSDLHNQAQPSRKEALHFLRPNAERGKKRLFIGIGANEWEDMVAGPKVMADRLSALEENGLTVRYRQFEGEEHITVLPSLVSRAIGYSLIPDVDGKWFGGY